jgi:hypothetical protein
VGDRKRAIEFCAHSLVNPRQKTGVKTYLRYHLSADGTQRNPARRLIEPKRTPQRPMLRPSRASPRPRLMSNKRNVPCASTMVQLRLHVPFEGTRSTKLRQVPAEQGRRVALIDSFSAIMSIGCTPDPFWLLIFPTRGFFD